MQYMDTSYVKILSRKGYGIKTETKVILNSKGVLTILQDIRDKL